MGVISKARDDHRVYRLILKAIGIPSHASVRGRIWLASGAPTCAASAEHETGLPVSAGDLVYDLTNANAYICSTAVAETTDAIFTAMMPLN